MSEHPQQPYYQEDEITLKELILKIQEFYREVFNNWKWIALITIPIIAYMMFGAFTAKPEYPAKLTFTINEDDGSSLAGMSGLLGQFGFGGVASEYNLDKILDLLKSRKITESVILKRDTIYGREDYLGNHMINHLDTLKEWAHVKWYLRPFKKTPNLKDFQFTRDSIESFELLENKAIKALYGKLIGGEDSEGLLKSSYSESSGILSMSMNAVDQRIGIAFVNSFFEELSKYYIDNTIEKQKVTYDLVVEKYDSLYTALRAAEYNYADFKDRSRGIFTRKSELDEVRLQNQITMLAAGLAKATENREIADFTLKNKTPFIQVIDRPLAPIKPARKSKLRTLIIACLLGGLIGAGYFIARKIIRDAMRA